MAYQGRLTDTATGNGRSGIVPMQFAIFDTADTGNQIWCEQQQAVALTDGYYSVQLGEGATCSSGTATLLASAFGAADRYLELSVDGSTLRPRLKIGSVPFAYVAQSGGTFKVRSISVEGEVVIGGQGTIAGFVDSAAISGGGSAFSSQIGPGDVLEAGGITIVVASVADDTHLTVAAKLAANLPNSTYTIKKPVARVYRSDGSVGLLANAQGNVGIGTVTPQAALDVNGNVNIKGSATVSGTINAVERLACIGRWGTWNAGSNTCTENIVASATPIVYANYPGSCGGGATQTCSCWSIMAAAPQLVGAGVNVNANRMWCHASEATSSFSPRGLRAEWWPSGSTDSTMFCATGYSPCIYIDARATGGSRSVIELGCCLQTTAYPAWCCR